eukprot:PLAT7020.8.p1 GENE.PLAT7020.8~~PLAT7020.8.p1  ORF type:complete len:497 (+),score=256.00 PLAT7020.8:468-1958(+)
MIDVSRAQLDYLDAPAGGRHSGRDGVVLEARARAETMLLEQLDSAASGCSEPREVLRLQLKGSSKAVPVVGEDDEEDDDDDFPYDDEEDDYADAEEEKTSLLAAAGSSGRSSSSSSGGGGGSSSGGGAEDVGLYDNDSSGWVIAVRDPSIALGCALFITNVDRLFRSNKSSHKLLTWLRRSFRALDRSSATFSQSVNALIRRATDCFVKVERVELLAFASGIPTLAENLSFLTEKMDYIVFSRIAYWLIMSCGRRLRQALHQQTKKGDNKYFYYSAVLNTPDLVKRKEFTLDAAVQDAVDIDSTAAVLSALSTTIAVPEKLDVIVEAAAIITACLRDGLADGVGADSFFPAFTAVVVRAGLVEPLQDIALIRSLTHPRVLSDEPGYYLTALESAVRYVLSLPLDKEVEAHRLDVLHTNVEMSFGEVVDKAHLLEDEEEGIHPQLLYLIKQENSRRKVLQARKARRKARKKKIKREAKDKKRREKREKKEKEKEETT